MLILAHPLQSNRLTYCARKQYCVGSGIVGAIATVRSGTVQVIHLQRFDWDGEELREQGTQAECVLRGRPYGGRRILYICDHTRRAERSMALERPIVGRSELLRSRGEGRRGVAALNDRLLVLARRRFHGAVQSIAQRQRLPFAPGRF